MSFYVLGTRYYSKVYAVDKANLESAVVFSDGFIVDTTPPKPQVRSIDSQNVLENPSFETVEEGGSALTSLEDVSTDSGARPDSWMVDDGAVCAVVEPDDGSSRFGSSFVAVKGQIHQQFTTVLGMKYRVTFFVSHMVASKDPFLNQEGSVEIVNSDNEFAVQEIFRLYDRPVDPVSSISWMFHQVEFTADHDTYMIYLGSVGEYNGILLDNIQAGLTSKELLPNWSGETF